MTKYTIRTVDIKSLRRKLGLSQNAFASRYGIPRDTIPHWENHRHGMTIAARALLHLIRAMPNRCAEVLEDFEPENGTVLR